MTLLPALNTADRGIDPGARRRFPWRRLVGLAIFLGGFAVLVSEFSHLRWTIRACEAR
jgi:hypothetical protein